MPTFYTTPGGSSKLIVYNPFEAQLFDKLKSNSPLYSPNMFRISDPGSAEKVLRASSMCTINSVKRETVIRYKF